MKCASNSQGMGHHRIRPGCRHCIVSSVLLLGGLGSVESPNLTWAAVYECLDVRGKSLLTNRPSHLHNCHMLSGQTGSDQTPSEVSSPPKVSPKPNISDRLSLPSYEPPVPLPLNLPAEQSLPPSVRPDDSGAQSQPETAPTPTRTPSSQPRIP